MEVILFTNEEGKTCVSYPCEGKTAAEVVEKTVPEGVEYEIVDSSVLPADRYFREAWVKEPGKITEDLTKTKDISHQRRRLKREEEFKPYDDIIAKQIPGNDAQEAEAARVSIRSKYETMQTDINAAASTEELKTIIEGGA